MQAKTRGQGPRTIKLDLPKDVAEALERRARRNDRYAYMEALRIIRAAVRQDMSSQEPSESK